MINARTPNPSEVKRKRSLVAHFDAANRERRMQRPQLEDPLINHLACGRLSAIEVISMVCRWCGGITIQRAKEERAGSRTGENIGLIQIGQVQMAIGADAQVCGKVLIRNSRGLLSSEHTIQGRIPDAANRDCAQFGRIHLVRLSKRER